MTEILCAGCGCDIKQHHLKFEDGLPTRTRCNKCKKCSKFVFPRRERQVLVRPREAPVDRTPTARWQWLIQIR